MEAVANVREIAAVDGIDVLFVGPADLAFDLKATGSSLTYDACLCAVADAARGSSKQTGILNRNENDVDALTAKGFTFQAVDSDIAIIRQRYLDLVMRFGNAHSV